MIPGLVLSEQPAEDAAAPRTGRLQMDVTDLQAAKCARHSGILPGACRPLQTTAEDPGAPLQSVPRGRAAACGGSQCRKHPPRCLNVENQNRSETHISGLQQAGTGNSLLRQGLGPPARGERSTGRRVGCSCHWCLLLGTATRHGLGLGRAPGRPAARLHHHQGTLLSQLGMGTGGWAHTSQACCSHWPSEPEPTRMPAPELAAYALPTPHNRGLHLEGPPEPCCNQGLCCGHFPCCSAGGGG